MKRLAIVIGCAGVLIFTGCVIEIVETDHHGYYTYDLHSDSHYGSCGSCHSTVLRVEVGTPGCWGCH